MCVMQVNDQNDYTESLPALVGRITGCFHAACINHRHPGEGQSSSPPTARGADTKAVCLIVMNERMHLSPNFLYLSWCHIPQVPRPCLTATAGRRETTFGDEWLSINALADPEDHQ